MLKTHPGEILGWGVNLYCGMLGFFLLFSGLNIAFYVTSATFPPATGPGLPPVQRLLLL